LTDKTYYYWWKEHVDRMSSDRAYRTFENIKKKKGRTFKIMEECSVKFVIGINRSN
jgi:hypothetical protein